MVVRERTRMNPYAIPGLRFTKNIIFNNTCSIYGQEREEVTKNNKNRENPYKEIRQVAMAAMRHFLKLRNRRMSYSEIGEYFGKDHATVMHACKTVQNYWDTDKEFRKNISPIFHGQRPEYKNKTE